jgi:ABC-type uncharacterized transport system permease subunit
VTDRPRGQFIGMAIVVAFACAILITLALTGIDLAAAGAALVRGAMGSPYAFFSGTLVRATPLILAGLAVTIAFRAGVLNIGAEGQLLAGAAAACAVGLTTARYAGGLTVPLMLATGALAGAVVAGIAAWLRASFNVLEVISTILLNFVAANAVSYLVRGPLQEPTRVFPQSASLPAVAELTTFGSATRLHIGFAIAIVACVIAWWWLRSTAAGFRLRVVGANPRAAQLAGRIDVGRVSALAFLGSGAIAGLAGAIELSGVTRALYENLSPGYGFTAVAVALLAKLNPLGVIATGIFFGALQAGGSAMQRDAGVPSAIVSVIEASVILLTVVLYQIGARGGVRRRANEPTVGLSDATEASPA